MGIAKKSIILLSSVIFITVFSFYFCKNVYAEDEISILEFPERLAEMTSLDLFTARLLASAILLLIFSFPILLIVAKFNVNQVILFMVGILIMGIETALGWLPPFIFVITILIIALMYGKNITDLVTRGKTD